MRIAATCILMFFTAACQPWGKPEEPPVAAQNIIDFQTLFTENCSGCHGVDGKNGPGRPLNDPLYLAIIPSDTLRQTIENGRPGTAMPAWGRAQGGPLYPKQVTALVNGIEQNWAKPAKVAGVALPAYSAGIDPGDAVHGKKLYVRACFMCHGQVAIGPVTNPTFLTLVTDQVLRTSIIAGRADLGMPDFRTLNLGHALSDQDITDLVAYLASLRPSRQTTESDSLPHVQGSGNSSTGNSGTGGGK